MSEIVFRTFEPRDWPDMVRFYEQFYRPRYIFTKREFFDWNFAAPPGSSSATGQHLALDGEKIIGILGGYPWPLQIAGHQQPGVSLINLFLDPEYRGRKLGHRLIEDYGRVLGHILGPGFNLRTLSMYERIGRTFPWMMRRITRPLDADAVIALLAHSPRYEELDEPSKKRVRARLLECASRAGVPHRLSFTKVDRFDAEWDDAWNTIRQDYGFPTWRSAEHLNWRYIDYPYPIYSCYLARADGDTVGLVVLRLEKSGVGNIVRLIDWIGTSGIRGDLLSFAIEWATSHDALLVDFFCGGSLDEDVLGEYGFFEAANAYGAALLPMDFNPLRCRDSMQMLAMFLDDTDERMREIESGEFYFVKGDGDQDRAN